MNKKIMSSLLICLGVIIFSYPKVSEIYFTYQQEKLLREWQTSLAAIDQGDFDSAGANPGEEDPSLDLEQEQLKPELERKKAREAYIKEHMEGILKIDKINLSLPILKGITQKNLNLSVASMDKTGKAGKIGNYALAGHRDHTFGRLFNRLNELEVGDLIEVDDGENSYKYKVTEKLYVKPEETWVLNKEGKHKDITLITCHPIKNPTHRLIIKGRI